MNYSFPAFPLLLAAFFAASSGRAQTIAQWTFEISQPAGFFSAGTWFTNISSEVGPGTASGLHAGNTFLSSPAGNGSAHSFSATNFAVGDFYQFEVSTVGFSGIRLEWDQTSSNTGPRDNRLDYSTDGINFTAFGSGYTILANASPNPTWNSTTFNAIYHYSQDLSSVTALNNASTVYFRLIDTSTTSANGGTVGSGGTDRVDNFTIEVVPEPQTLALLSGFGILALNFIRRRK